MNKNNAKHKNVEIKKMFAYAGNYHYMTIFSCILVGISTILSMIPFACIWFIVRDLIEAFKKGNIKLATNSSTYAWMAFGFSVASILIYYLALNLSHLAAFRTAKNMKKEAMHHILKLPLGYFKKNDSGRIRKIIDDNVNLTEGFLAHQIPDITGAVVMPIAIIIIFFTFDWKMGICCLIPLLISVLFLKQMMGGDNSNFMAGYMDALETMNKEAVEYIRGIPVIKVFQKTLFSFKNFYSAIKQYKKYASDYAIKCRIPLTGFNVTLNSTFILLIPVALFIAEGAIGNDAYINVILNFLFYSLFTPLCITMMNRIMFASEQLMAAKSAVARIEKILQEQPLKETKEAKIPKNYCIEFDHVTFAYAESDSDDILKDISFFIKEGETVALVGASGSGKSTIASLVPRFYDVKSGSVKIGGIDVRNIKTNDLMNIVSFVFQRVKLFKGSLLDNIKMANKSASLEKVKEAITAAQCDEIVNKLNEGLNTNVGTGGTYLSGGEAQRIALARAILKNAPIVVLDEATAFADAENENKIQEALDKLTKDKTVLIIAHRLSTIKNVDKIIVIDSGKIVEQGTHEELLKMEGKYNKMWNDYQTSIAWQVKNDKKEVLN